MHSIDGTPRRTHVAQGPSTPVAFRRQRIFLSLHGSQLSGIRRLAMFGIVLPEAMPIQRVVNRRRTDATVEARNCSEKQTSETPRYNNHVNPKWQTNVIGKSPPMLIRRHLL